MLILGLNRCKGVDFSMPFSASYMIAFTDDSTIPTHDNGSDVYKRQIV